MPEDDTALILIDLQCAFRDAGWGRRNNPKAEDNAGRLLGAWRQLKRPVIHVQHQNPDSSSLFQPGSAGSEPLPGTAPKGGEPIVAKKAHCAFVGTDLEARLREMGVETVVLAGLTTDHCVSTTARIASDLGFKTIVVGDATATFERVTAGGRRWPARTVHEAALASLDGEFAKIVCTGQVLAAHPT